MHVISLLFSDFYMENYVHGTVQLIELLFDDKLVNLIEDGSEQIEQKFEYLLFKFERSLRPKQLLTNRKGFSTPMI